MLVCLRIIIELHKQFRPPLQSEVQYSIMSNNNYYIIVNIIYIMNINLLIYYYYYLYRYSIFYNLWRQFTKIYQQMWYDDLHIQVLHVYKTVWLEICFQCFLTQQNKQQNEAVFLLFFRNNSLTLCQYQPLGFYQQRTMLVPPLLPSLTLG